MMNVRFWNAAMALLTAAALVVSPVRAQSQQAATPAAQTQPGQTRSLKLSEGPDYSKSPRWFPDIIAPYSQRHVPLPTLTNSARIADLIQNGKLMLSLEDTISLALENNMDIAVQRFTPWLDQAALLNAESGILNTLPFDPTVTSTLNMEEQSVPVNNPLFAGLGFGSAVSAVENHSSVANFGYTQAFHTGTQVQVSFNNTRSSTSSTFSAFNPAVQSTLQVQLTQPLLNGFGLTPNTRYIIEAKNTVKVGESQFAQQVITSVTTAATDYWELVYARENVKVEEAAVATSQKLYEDNKKQLEIGTMAPLDVLTAESQLASDQQNLIVAQTVQLQDQTKLLYDITKDALAGPLASIEIVPTTPISAPAISEDIPLPDAVKEAWQKRPEVQQAELKLKNAGIEVKATRNGLLPSLSIFGLYSTTGLDGTRTPAVPTGAFDVTGDVFATPGTSGVIPAGTPVFAYSATPQTIPGTPISAGLPEAWDQLIHSRFPTFEGGLNLTLPVRNRAAQAASATALLNEREQETAYRQLQNSIVVGVRSAQIALTQGRAQVAAAEKARALAQEALTDETKKYQLGASTSYNVVLRERDLTTAQGSELRARINLIEAELTFNQTLGRTLDANHIVLAGLRTNASPGPNIPGTPEIAPAAGN